MKTQSYSKTAFLAIFLLGISATFAAKSMQPARKRQRTDTAQLEQKAVDGILKQIMDEVRTETVENKNRQLEQLKAELAAEIFGNEDKQFEQLKAELKAEIFRNTSLQQSSANQHQDQRVRTYTSLRSIEPRVNQSHINQDQQFCVITKKLTAYENMLVVAAKSQNDRRVAMLIRKNAPASTKFLLAAARCGNREWVDYALKKNININNKIRRSQTALAAAIQSQNFELACYLLEQGANPAIVNKFGNNALHILCIHGGSGSQCLRLITMILNKNQSLFYKLNNKKETPIDIARRCGRIFLLQCLQEKKQQMMRRYHINLYE